MGKLKDYLYIVPLIIYFTGVIILFYDVLEGLCSEYIFHILLFIFLGYLFLHFISYEESIYNPLLISLIFLICILYMKFVSYRQIFRFIFPFIFITIFYIFISHYLVFNFIDIEIQRQRNEHLDIVPTIFYEKKSSIYFFGIFFLFCLFLFCLYLTMIYRYFSSFMFEILNLRGVQIFILNLSILIIILIFLILSIYFYRRYLRSSIKNQIEKIDQNTDSCFTKDDLITWFKK